ncbi:MAG: GyrI-like domain-containing protein [Phycisphaerae bacterium]
MNESDLKARLKELYLPPADDFVLVDVPDLRYVMIDGRGAADRTALDHAVKWLFAAIYPLKRVARERMQRNFVEPPLEGLWWADDLLDFMQAHRDKLIWRMMIVYEPDWLTPDMFRDGVDAAKARLGEPPPGLRLESYHEGLSVQIMHVGPPSAIASTLARLHREFLPAHHLVPNGRHHEIYLTDPNRVAPDKMKTVLRQPVLRSQ